MKKLKVLMFVTMLTMMLAIPTNAHQVDVYEEGDLVKSVVFRVGSKEYVVNDAERHPMEVAPFIYDGRTFVPVRFLGNALGVTNEQIKWDGATNTATLTRGQYTIALTIGSKTALRNGVKYYMGVSPQITEGRTQLPARFVAEGLGYNVAWCGERQIVIVYTGDTVPEVTKLPEAKPYVVTFLSANLEAAVRDALGKPTGNITKADMAKLTNLEANRHRITNLSGLEYAVNLTSLNLEYNRITDITPLTGLTNLTSLNLRDNPITDITPLAGLTNLTSLNLRDSRITDNDITLLSGLTNLTTLRLGENRITDITPLSGLTNLTTLCLGRNPITDITPLSGLTNLTSLGFYNNQITDITPLAGLTNLTTLELGFNQITDITPLNGLTNLTTLGLCGNQITDITPLNGLTNLTTLGLVGNQITDITPLTGLTNLTKLRLRFNQITDITPLVNNTGLGYGDSIYLSNNPLDLTPGSQDMQDIETLRARGVTVKY